MFSSGPNALVNLSVCPQDDMLIRVFNYNTLDRVHMFEAHSDYIRCVAVHPTQPYILTSSGRKRSACAHANTSKVLCLILYIFLTVSRKVQHIQHIVIIIVLCVCVCAFR